MALVRAKESFWLPNKQLVSQGVLLDSAHPLVARFVGKFEPVEQSPGFDVVESATSAPGEKRSTVARNRKPAADKADSEASEDD